MNSLPQPPTWDDTFIELCFVFAKRSKDQSTRCGCVAIGPDKEIRSMGYNGQPRGCDDDNPKRHERPAKYWYTEHAERNMVFNAARIGVSLLGCILYITGPPCADCTRGIIQSGIKEIICASNIAPERFRGNVTAAMEMLKEAGIPIRFPNSNSQMEIKFTSKEGWGDDRSRPY